MKPARIVTVAVVGLTLVVASGLCGYWYFGEPVADSKIRQLTNCSSKQSVLEVLGKPTSVHYGDGREYWEYHGSFLGIRTVLHLDVVFTNDTYYTWAMMD